jgi:predicted thioredoxin/glutaredoxin
MQDLHFTLYTRAGCSLCEEMQDELASLPQAAAIPVRLTDVDQDPALRLRYGHKVPVLLLGGELVCHGRLDVEEVEKALAYHR